MNASVIPIRTLNKYYVRAGSATGPNRVQLLLLCDP